MQIIDVPIFNDDGSIKFTQQLSPEEAQYLLQLAINITMHLGSKMQVVVAAPDDIPTELND